MKRSIIFSVFAGLLFLSACQKEDNAKLPEIMEGPALPLITKDLTTNLVITAQDPDAFTAKYTVDLYFKNGTRPDKFDIVVMKNGNKSNVKVLQAGVTTFPSIFTVTGPQLATLFGSPIVAGDRFDIGADITQGGQKFLAFPTEGSPYNSGVATQSGASIGIRYEAVCQFTAADYAGNFEVVLDEWADYPEGTIIPVTAINDHQLSFEYNAFDAQPIIVNVDLITNDASVEKQVYGNYGTPPAWTYGDISVESITSQDNFVAPCEGTLSLVLEHTVAAGSFGDYRIILKKVQ